MYTTEERISLASMMFSKDELKTMVRALYEHREELNREIDDFNNAGHGEQTPDLEYEVEETEYLMDDLKAAIKIINGKAK